MTTTPVSSSATRSAPSVTSADEVVFLMPKGANGSQLLALAQALGLPATVDATTLKVASVKVPQRIATSPLTEQAAAKRIAELFTSHTTTVAVGMVSPQSTCLSGVARAVIDQLNDSLTGLIRREVTIAVYDISTARAALVTPTAPFAPAPAAVAADGAVGVLFGGLLGARVPAQRRH
jgi:hypothetical protein